MDTTFTLMTGGKVEFIQPRGGNYAKAMRAFSMQKEYDLTIFLMVELVKIDGEFKPLEFYTEMYCDDYVKVATALGDFIAPIK